MPRDFMTKLGLHIRIDAGLTAIPERVKIFHLAADQIVIDCADKAGWGIILWDDSLPFHLEQIKN